jgi:N4-(beta-N-acetylglucosaminyl)-L-asparaginase
MSELVLSTWSFGTVANAAAWPVLLTGGSPLDAVVAGATAATGNGELIMGTCGSFLAVELMHQGWGPQAACVEVLRRIAARKDIVPDHQVALIALAPAAAGGGWASAALHPGFVHVVSDVAGTRVQSPHAVLLPA